MISTIKNLKNIYRIYPDYETAYKNSDPNAYQAEEIVEVVFQKTLIYKEFLDKNPLYLLPSVANSFCCLIPKLAENINNSTIKVIDFGGACGALYFQIRKILPKNLKLLWAVVETPAMVNKAKVLENQEISFHNSLVYAFHLLEKVDIFHTSATIQALDNPREYLKKMVSIPADYAFFNRIGVHKGKNDIYTVHKSKLSWNGPGDLPKGFQDKWVKYPYSFISEEFFLNTIEKKYQILAKFEDKSGIYPVFGYPIEGYALLCKLK